MHHLYLYKAEVVQSLNIVFIFRLGPGGQICLGVHVF